MRIERFNENHGVRHTSTPDSIIVGMFDDSNANLFQRMEKNGYKLYYFDFDLGEFINLPLNINGYPYKEYQKEIKNRFGRVIKDDTQKKSMKYQKNPWGTLYFLNDEELEGMKEIGSKVSEVLKKIEQQKKLVSDLIGSHLIHNVSTKNNSNDE